MSGAGALGRRRGLVFLAVFALMASFLVFVDAQRASATATVTARSDATVNGGDTVSTADGGGTTYTISGIAESAVSGTVDWGDGSPAEAIPAAQLGSSSGPITMTHVFATAGAYTVTVTVVDNLFSPGSDTFDVTVVNTQPEVTAAVTKTGLVSVKLSPTTFTDPDFAPHTATIDWGDGSPVEIGTVTQTAGGGEVDGTHTYAAGGTYTVTVTVVDSASSPFEGSAFDSTTVTVGSSDPVVTALATRTGLLSVVLSPSTFTDPDFAPHTATIDWGDGSPVEIGTVTPTAGGGEVSGSHTYAALGAYTITVTVVDDASPPFTGSGFDTTTVTLGNVDPAVTALATVTGPLSAALSPSAFSDPDFGPHTATIDWGDGSPVEIGTVTPTAGGGTVDGAHTYATTGTYTITVTVVDDASPPFTGAGSDTTTVTFTNADPVVNAQADLVTPEGFDVVLSPSTFTDPDFAPHTATIDWGDGSPVDVGSVTPTPGGGTVDGAHTYAATGTYTITVTVVDDASPPGTGVGSDSTTVTVVGSTPVLCDGRVPTIVGTDAGETIIGTEDPDVILALGGDDIIRGLGGNDWICAGDGDDLIDGGPGNDRFFGGNGVDTATYAGVGAAVRVDLAARLANGGGGNDRLRQVENVIGSAFNDKLQGDLNDNKLEGRAGNDVLKGRRGDDTLLGGSGDDRLIGRADDDILDGGSGRDTVGYLGSPAGIVLSLIGGTSIGDGTDTLSRIEDVRGSKQTDTIVGSNKANKIVGFDGDDTIEGRGGDDDVNAKKGNDTMLGGTGDDKLNGGSGEDTANGGAGIDKCLKSETLINCELPTPSRFLFM